MNSTEGKDTNIIDFAEEKECHEFSDLLNTYEECSPGEEVLAQRIASFKEQKHFSAEEGSPEYAVRLKDLGNEVISDLQKAFMDYSAECENGNGGNKFLKERLICVLKDYDVFCTIFDRFMNSRFSTKRGNEKSVTMSEDEFAFLSRIKEIFSLADLSDTGDMEVLRLKDIIAHNFDVVTNFFTTCFQFVVQKNTPYSSAFKEEYIIYSITLSQLLYYPLWDYLEICEKDYSNAKK